MDDSGATSFLKLNISAGSTDLYKKLYHRCVAVPLPFETFIMRTAGADFPELRLLVGPVLTARRMGSGQDHCPEQLWVGSGEGLCAISLCPVPSALLDDIAKRRVRIRFFTVWILELSLLCGQGRSLETKRAPWVPAG